jgi:hypothetical protein
MDMPWGKEQPIADAVVEGKPPGAGERCDSEKPKIFGFQVSQ